MKNLFARSVLSAFLISLCGTAFNALTYFMYHKLILSVKISGDIPGQRGLGMALKNTADGAVLSFDLMSFLIPFGILFLTVLIINWRKYVIIRQHMSQGDVSR